MVKYTKASIAFKHKKAKYSSKSKSYSSGYQESPLITPKPSNNSIFFNNNNSNKVEHFKEYSSFKLNPHTPSIKSYFSKIDYTDKSISFFSNTGKKCSLGEDDKETRYNQNPFKEE